MECWEFFSLNGRDKIFWHWLTFFYTKLVCFLSLLVWCKESMIHHLWRDKKSLSDHTCAVSQISGLHQFALAYSHQSTVWVSVSHILLLTLSSKNVSYSRVENYRYYVHLPTDPKFHKWWTFGHVWGLQAPHVLFHQSKRCSVDNFFHHCESLPAVSCGIYVPTNI